MISDIYNQVENPSRGNNVQFKKCSPATSAGAQARTTTGGEVTVSDFVARRPGRTQWFGSIARRRSTGAHLVSDRTQAHGAGTKSKVGKGSAGIQASGWESEKCVTRETRDVSIRPPQDCGGSAGAVGEG
jgi:hypothetical protein